MKLGYGMWALICLSILNKSVGTKAMVHAPLFPAGEISLPLLEKDRTLDLLVVGNGVPLILVCVQTSALSRGFLFLVPHLMWFFGVSGWFGVFDVYVWLSAAGTMLLQFLLD